MIQAGANDIHDMYGDWSFLTGKKPYLYNMSFMPFMQY